MRSHLITWSARGVLALVALSLAASAQASAIYSFTFTSTTTGNILATGSFTTGAPNHQVPGYELIDSIQISIADSTSRTWGPFVSIGMPADPSYNPTTQTFTNFDTTGTQPGLGDVFFANSPGGGASLVLDTTSFDISRHYFFAAVTDRSGPFPFPPATVVSAPPGTANLVITAAAVPEPTTLVLLATGLLGAVVSRRRARASSSRPSSTSCSRSLVRRSTATPSCRPFASSRADG
jgi:hypothetical protein